ncbi:MAG: ABC transporter substrate-binding protein [Desulfurococcales archaeon]|nr:ABC transporter substrate-binding protein [Desulfurococcales archaeon]
MNGRLGPAVAGAIVVLVVVAAAFYLAGGSQGSAPTATATTGAGATSASGSSGGSQAGSSAGGGPSGYTIRAATLLGGISTLDIIEAENLTYKRGYPLEVLRLQKTPDILAAISKGEADLAVVPAEMAAKLIEGGEDVVIVAVDMLQNQAILAKDPSIRSVGDLRGKLVGAVVASGTYKVFKAYLETVYGLQVVEANERRPDAVAVVNVPPGSILDALASGQVDAIVIWEPFVSKGIARGFHVVASFSQLWREANLTGDPVMLVWIARGDFARHHEDALRAFLDARSEAAHIWNTNKTLTYLVIAGLYKMDQGVFNIMYNRTVIVEGGLTGELVESIRQEWWLAWKGGYLPRDPATIPDSVFYTG